MDAGTAKLSPAMERYVEVKGQNPGTILLFRMGDFYELFFEDAEIAAKVLGITLTSRDKGSANPIPMAGFPYHALESYLHKLIRAGYRAAICEQMEDPKLAKGLVRREVTQIVTPGTVTDENLLDPRESNYLASIFVGKSKVGLAWLEVSTGRFFVSDLDIEQIPDELARIRPSELLVSEAPARGEQLMPLLNVRGMLITKRLPWMFAAERCVKLLLTHFQTSSLAGFDVEIESAGVTAAGALLEYVQETQKSSLSHILKLEPFRRGRNLIIDEATRVSLELTRTIREGRRDGSLLDCIDQTVTPMGARLIAEWLSNPLTDIKMINARLDAIEELSPDTLLCRELREQLSQIYDLQRLTARIATGRCSPRDLGSLCRTLSQLPKIKAKLAGRKADLLCLLEADLDLVPEVRADIEAALVDDPPLLTSDGGMIRSGYHSQLDEFRELARGGKEWIAKYQAREIERTGISSLKVGFNKVFGYYIEVTSTHKDKIPSDYIRKQTLVKQERFITPELKEYEEKVLRAEDEAKSLELTLFNQLRERVAKHVMRLKSTGDVLAEIDVLFGLSILASTQRFNRPEMTEDATLDIRDGRHPVVEGLQPTGEFVPNDILLGGDYGRVQIITGPNMAGKSTYIRQAALITVLAQMGSFVPAKSARIGVADRIFARVGASDELSKGQSTFMVEMTETARILNSASERSLVVLDEIGRGTSTYDGISLAWAVTEFLHDSVRCRTLFATHYHELTDLTSTLKQASNWNVAVHEKGDGIIFLHKIVEGSADKSYGIHVARLAGVPRAVIERAQVILETLENDHVDETGKTKIPARPQPKQKQLQLFIADDHPVIEELRKLNIDELTPIAALQALSQFHQQVR